MARMNRDRWAEIRATWEADPRESLSWIISEMQLPVSHEAIRRRSKQEGWAKVASLKSIVEQAQKKADSKKLEEKVGRKVGKKLDDPTLPTSLPSASDSADLRAEVIETHRTEWQDHRNTFALSYMAGSEGGLDFAKRAKTAADTIKVRQEGERKAWGLDAVETDPNSGMKTIAELDAMYEQAMRRTEEMREAAQKRFRKLTAAEVAV